MGITTTFSEPFLTSGSPSTKETPHLYPVAIDGVGFMLDDTQDWGHATIQLLREQADTGTQPSEQTLSPEDLWRRSHESWHRGAGQQFLDRPESDPYRFRSSKGVDPWTKWQLSLLPDTTQALAATGTNLKLAVVGSYLYAVDGANVKFTTDLSTWTTMTGLSGLTIQSITSDGYHVYITDGADIYRSVRGTTAAGAAWNTLDSDLLGYAKGRLMSAHDNEIHNVTSGTPPSVLFTHPNTDFRWVGFAGTPGTSFIYCAGYSGDKALIYKTAVKADGTALDVPVVSGELPDGELVHSIAGFLNYLLIGTSKGVRFCSLTGDGDVNLGALIGPNQPIRCFEPQDTFVWFGWTNYDSTDTGLGRIDLREFTDTSLLAPSYASDLMATTQGNVLDVVTFSDERVFAVSGQGIYRQSSNRVSTGSLDSGGVTYGLSADDKVAMYVDLRHEPLAGSVSVALSTDGGDFVNLGTSNVANTTEPTSPLLANQSKGQSFELRYTLARSATDNTAGPDLTRATLRSFPAPPRSKVFLVPLLLADTLTLLSGEKRHADPEALLAFLENLVDISDVVTYQYGQRQVQVKVESVDFRPHHMTEDRQFWNGTATVKLKKFSQG